MRFCLEASNQRSPKNIFQSRVCRAKAHIKRTSAAKAVLVGWRKKRGFGSFLGPFKPQISPQLSRNYCLLPGICWQGGVITSHKTRRRNPPSSTSASGGGGGGVISPSEHAELSVSTYVPRAVAVNQYLAGCCGGIWTSAFHSSPLDRCHCEMDTAE